MTFEGAVVREQGVTFAIIVVKPNVMNTDASKREAIMSFMPHFSGMPIILMSQDSRGIPQYYGRRDIVSFLANISISRIPWKEYRLTSA